MSEQQPATPPGELDFLLGCLGTIMLLPGLCSLLVFAIMSPSDLLHDPVGALWLVCLLIGAGASPSCSGARAGTGDRELHFMHPFNLCVGGVKRSCIHFVTPQSQIIPFDTYNLFCRDGRTDGTRAAIRAEARA
jgi:hypothetical protein